MKREGGENPSHSGRCCDPETPDQGNKRHAMFFPFRGPGQPDGEIFPIRKTDSVEKGLPRRED